MANTVTTLSYANTFGDWLVATDALIGENNTLAEGDYSKDSGTLYLSESTKSALQSNGNVIVQKALIVQGVGSYASIERNFDVQGQAYFTNSTLSLATTGNANVGKTLEVLGSGNSFIVANNAIIGGNVAVSYGTITRTLQANNTVNTSNASIVHSVYANKLQANTSILTDVAVANSSIYTNYLQANTYVLTQTLKSNNEILTAAASVTGTTHTNALQANNYSNTANASIVWTLYANVVQANTSVNTSNASVVNTVYTKDLQANNSTNTSNASIVWTLYANVVQANTSVNTTTLSVTNNTLTDILQANTLVNTTTLSVTGTTFTDVLQANTAANTTTVSVTGTTFTDVLQANTSANTTTLSVTGTATTNVLQSTIANTRTLSVTGTTFTDVLQANTSANTTTLSVTGTTFTDVLQANTSANTSNISVTHNTYTNALQANTVANTRTMSVTGTTHTDILIANTYSRTTNAFASDTVRSETLYANSIVWTPNITVTELIDANDASAFFNSLEVENNLSIGGNFVINGKTVYNTNEFTLSAGSPSQTSFFTVYRTNNALQLANSVYANAQIRWNEAQDYFDIKDVATEGDYYRIITEQQLSGSTTSTSTILAASSAAANTLNNNIQTANTFLKARIDTADSFANGAFVRANSSYTSQNISGLFANSAFAHANASFAAANNVGPQITPAFNHANAAFNKANSATSQIKGTTGSISPTEASLTFKSNNGIVFYATSSNTFAVSTSQDLQSGASPTFASLSLTSPLSAPNGGTGSTSLASAFNALVANATGTQSGTAGYVLATGGAGNFYWTSAPSGGGGGATPGTRITSNRLTYSGDSTTTLFATPTFSQANQVRIYINGVRQLESEYTLNSATSRVTLTTAPYTGDTVLVEVDGYTTYEYYANNIAYGPVTGSIPSSANTIQLAIDDLESRKMPKIGGTFTGDVTGLTMPNATANTSFATTAFVAARANAGYTFTQSITGNAGTVTNGLYSTGSYADPSFITSLSAAKLTTGTIPSTTLGLSTLYVGTTAITLNRASATQTLTGISIDGNAGTVGTLSVHSGINNEANKLVRTDATGNTSFKYINTSAHEKVAASPTYVLGSLDTGTSATLRTYQTSSLSVSYAATAGSASASDVALWAKAATRPTYTKSDVGLNLVDNTADSAKNVLYAATAGSAPANGGTSNYSNYSYNLRFGSVGNWNTDFTNTTAGSVRILGDVDGGTNAPATGWWFQDNYRHSNASNAWGTQVAWGWETNANNLRTRSVSNGTYGAWVNYLNSANYSSYALPITGGTLSGLLIGKIGNVVDINDANDAGSISVRGDTTYPAVMSFHRGGAYAINMGLSNVNNFVIGGWSASRNAFVMSGAGALTMLNNITAFSDERVKTNWRELPENFVDKLAEVKHGIYDRTDQESTQVGVSAQSLRPLLEHAVMENEEGQLSVAYGNAALVACIKLAQRLLESEKQIKELKSEMETLKGQIK
jgi:hypothetical protein